jgi:hypothetical protein
MIELLIVVILMLLVVTMISSAFLLSANASEDIINLTTNEIDARVAVYRITKDLWEADNISIAYNDELRFNSNVDLDDDIEVVHYYLQGHEDGYYELYRQIDEGTPKIAATHVVDDNMFNYYFGVDDPEGGTTTPNESERAEIRLIDISIWVDQNGEETISTMKLETLIYLRNKI